MKLLNLKIKKLFEFLRNLLKMIIKINIMLIQILFQLLYQVNILKILKLIDSQNLKKTEINRIFKEFIENDYQNKYHVSVDVVLAALLGEHNKNVEINKFAKFKREYFDEINNIRFFEFGKNKHSI